MGNKRNDKNPSIQILGALIYKTLKWLGLPPFTSFKCGVKTIKDVRYMFVDECGKEYSLSEEELIHIAQEYKSGILMSIIAGKHNLSVIRLSRVLSFIQSQQTFNF